MTVSAKSQTLTSELRNCVKVEVDVLGSVPNTESVWSLGGRKATLKKKLFDSSSSHGENEQRDSRAFLSSSNIEEQTPFT